VHVAEKKRNVHDRDVEEENNFPDFPCRAAPFNQELHEQHDKKIACVDLSHKIPSLDDAYRR